MVLILTETEWEQINTNIPESNGEGSQYWGAGIGIDEILNKRINQD